MPKTYGTVVTFTAGSVLTATQMNTIGTAVNNLVVPASCQLVRTSDLTSYTSQTDVTFSSASWDTDSMFNAGTPTRITINTAGLYVVTMVGAVSATATMTAATPFIALNGSTSLAYHYVPVFSSTNHYWVTSFVYSFAASDFISFRVGFTGGSAYVVRGAATTQDIQTRMSVTWIGRTS
jgi:hypothetical protein